MHSMLCLSSRDEHNCGRHWRRLGESGTHLDASRPRTESEEAAAAGCFCHLPVEVQVPPCSAGASQHSPPPPANRGEVLPSAGHTTATSMLLRGVSCCCSRARMPCMTRGPVGGGGRGGQLKVVPIFRRNKPKNGSQNLAWKRGGEVHVAHLGRGAHCAIDFRMSLPFALPSPRFNLRTLIEHGQRPPFQHDRQANL